MPIDDSVLQALHKRFGVSVVNTADFEGWRVSTGFPELDEWMGGGLPRGRIIELYGMESTGKSTFALELAKRVQQSGEHVVWDDSEWSFDEQYAQSIGLDLSPDKFLLLRPRTMEESFDMVRTLCLKAPGGFYVKDSLAASPPKSVLENLDKDPEKRSADRLGDHSLAVSNMLRAIGQDIGQSGAIFLIINQVRTKMQKGGPGGMLVSQTTTGGNALKFYAAMRWKIARLKQISRTHPRTQEQILVWECALHMTKTKVSKTEGQEIKIWIVPEFGVRVAKARQQIKE